jgi:PDZ domain-containing protein
VAASVLYFAPSNEYIFLPDAPRNVDPLVRVPGETDVKEQGGIYMVDIVVRKASLLEKFFPQLHDGASLVPASSVIPPGVTESEQRQQSLDEMSQSQKIAAAVALRALGYKVAARPVGVEVTGVLPDQPADGKLEIGDRIEGVNGHPVRTLEDLRGEMAKVDPGQDLTFRVRRSGGGQDIRLGTRENPANAARAFVGITIDQSVDIRLPLAVKIDSGSIGGPSAGLAFALDIYDELGHDIDDDKRIVVTGALMLDGKVGEIGGIKQKTIAAREADADLFLVPDANEASARRYADGLEVVPVTTFREALSVLTKE